MYIFIYLFVCLFNKALSDTDTVPVFIIDDDRVLSDIKAQSNPFERISPTKFLQLLETVASRSARVIIFVEDKFCAEDISGTDELGTPYYFLRQDLMGTKVKYFPAVKSAFSVIKSLFLADQTIYLESITTNLNINSDRFKYIHAYFKDSKNETRTHVLRKHDLMIKQTNTALRQIYPGPIVAIYTGMSNAIDIDEEMKKFRYNAARNVPETSSDVLLIRTNTTIFEFTGMTLLINDRRWPQERPWSIEESSNETSIRTKLQFAGVFIEFNFELTKTEWALTNIKMYEEDVEVGSLRTSIRAPWGISFACHEKLELENSRDGSVFTIPKYQIEPIKEWLDGKPSSLRTLKTRYFKASVNCGPFFSAAIMMSLFIVGILLLILFYGIVSIMDVRTNSRYDDPHGKQLMYADAGDIK